MTSVGWLSPEDLELVRAHVPLVYVDAMPVRVDGRGVVTEIGLLLRVAADGSISRMVVSGRVLFGERSATRCCAIWRRISARTRSPRCPLDPAPFTVVEYFPDPERSGFHDPRHHAVSLAYVVPVDGDCFPTQEALDLAWFSPSEAVSAKVREQMTAGQDRLIRLALAHVGCLPSAATAERTARRHHPPRPAGRRTVKADARGRHDPSHRERVADCARRPQDDPLRGAAADGRRAAAPGGRSNGSRATASTSRSSGTTA